jgi:L,D-transpeptidase catalytic domain
MRIRKAIGVIRKLTAAAALAAAAAGVVATPASAEAPVRAWQGMLVRSLDPPPPARGAQAPATSSADSAVSTDDAPPPRDQRLSDERRYARWAYTAALGYIYAGPRPGARRKGRLRWYTEDGFPEVYLLLRSHWDSAGREWIQLRMPARPNGQIGWVRRDALDEFHFTRNVIVVDRHRLRMTVYTNGRRRWSAPVGVGKAGTPTPAGRFWIRERFKILDRGSGYWPYAFGTADYSSLTDWPGGGVVGIHGPYYEPGAIPGHPSHGCIRLHTWDDAWLAKHVSVGTPLRVV